MELSYLKIKLVIFACMLGLSSYAQEVIPGTINQKTPVTQDTLPIKGIQKDNLSKDPLTLKKGIDTAKSAQKKEPKENIDTVSIKYFYATDIDTLYNFSDSSIVDLDNYHPANKDNAPYLHLGNFGAASTPLLYQNAQELGINYGFDAYELYNFDEDSIKIFDTYRPINDLYFSPHSGQENFYVKARFARTFSDVSFNINYRRIIQEGFYLNQGTQTTNLTTSFYYKSADEKLHTIWSLIVNNNNENHNGGILTTATETDLFYYSQPLYFVRDRLPTQIDGANSRNAQAALVINNRYNLKEKADSDFNLGVKHNFKFEKSNVKFSDDNTSGQEAFYGYFHNDDRGIRQYQSQTSLANDLGLFIKKSQLVSFDLGLKYVYHRINYSPLSENLNELILYGRARSNYKNIGIKAFAELGSLSITGDLNAGGTASYNHSFFNLSGGLRIFRIRPNLRFETLYVNEERIYNNTNLRKPFGSDLHATIDLKPLKLKVTAVQSIENNVTYFDSLGLVNQLEDVLSVTKLIIASQMDYKSIHLDNYLLLQVNSSDELSFAKYHGKSRLYLKTKIFSKKLETQIGGEIIYTPKQRARRFLPVVGAFGHTSDEIDGFPMLNAYINFKVREFKMFFKFENFLDYGSIRPYYQIIGYPQLDARFRMGASWLLYN